MKYFSTRSARSEGVSSAFAIKSGLASDGGLYMPEEIPKIDLGFISSLIPLSYPERAAKILSLFLSDFTYAELLEDANAAYGNNKFSPSPAPVTRLNENEYMLELWHGPTSAFKDMALQIMPRLFSRAMEKCGEKRTALILVATSGDTGKAALEGYRDVDGTAIKVFYPIDGVSRVQKLQMQTQEGKNVSVVGIEGNFDDAQNGVKRIFSDPAVKDELDLSGAFLSSANSINWGRLVPQVVYYVSAYCDLLSESRIALGDVIDVTVPTGNFGNIFAGYIAKLMGVPIGNLVCASNKNNVLTDFLNSGVYDRNRPFHKTSSPSMDILISSNLERLLYLELGPARTAQLMSELNAYGKYALKEAELNGVRKSFFGYFTDEDECRKTVKDCYENSGKLIDTHTAVAVCAADKYLKESGSNRPMLIVSTASAYKFAADVLRDLGEACTDNELEAPRLLEKLTGVTMPSPLRSALEKKPIHTRVIKSNEMTREALSFPFS